MPVYRRAADLRDQLCAEADAQGWQPRIDGFREATPLQVQPRVVPLIVHTHRSTEADDTAKAAQRRRQGFLEIQTAHLYRDTFGNEHLPKGTEVLVWMVLYDQ